MNRPTPPVQPQRLRWLIQDHNTLQKTINKIVIYGQGSHLVPDLMKDLKETQLKIEEWNRSDECVAFNRAVAEYNDQAKKWNEAIKKNRQAKINERESKKIQAATCTRCFCVHAGEC